MAAIPVLWSPAVHGHSPTTNASRLARATFALALSAMIPAVAHAQEPQSGWPPQSGQWLYELRPLGYSFENLPVCNTGLSSSASVARMLNSVLALGGEFEYARNTLTCFGDDDPARDDPHQHGFRLLVFAGGAGRFGRVSGIAGIAIGPAVRRGRLGTEDAPWGVYIGFSGTAEVAVHRAVSLGFQLRFGATIFRGPGDELDETRAIATLPVSLLPLLRISI